MHAAPIIKPLVVCPRNDDVVVAIQHLAPILVNLALFLLCNLIFTIPKFILEDALVPVTSFLVNDSTAYVMLEASVNTLKHSCQQYPNLSLEKLVSVVPALLKLIKSNILTILTSASWGLALLCDGMKEMVVEDEYLDSLIECLLHLINADGRVMIISGLPVLGSIVRWCSDNAIEAIIKKEYILASLMCLLEEVDMYYVKQAFWIISNITATKEEHIKAVIDCTLIDPILNVAQNHELSDVEKEALWEISNAMCGVAPSQIEHLRNSFSKVLWDELLDSFLDDSLPVLDALEGLVNLKLVEVTCDGRPIGAVELHYIFQKIVYHTERFTKYKTLYGSNSVQISDGRLKYLVMFKFKGRQPRISLSCDSLEFYHYKVEECIDHQNRFSKMHRLLAGNPFCRKRIKED